jgi:aldehyde oxidoreductase
MSALQKRLLTINGVQRMLVVDTEKDTLATALRRLGLTGTKVGCGVGQCGACSVIVDGKVVRACARKIKSISEHSELETIEGIGTPKNLHPLQQAFITYGSVQCGFCSPGFIMSAKGLLEQKANPTREQVREWFTKHRNVCRCTGYKPIVDAVMAAAKVMRGEATMADITYKPEGNQVYGTACPRPAALAKVTGLCDYGDDIKYKLPGDPLHLAIVQPRLCSHGKILSIDISAAEAAPGVVKVVTAKDIKGLNKVVVPVDHPRTTLNGFERPLLCDTTIYRYGDVVAIVIAESEEQAREAAKLVKVEIEPLPEYMNYLDAVAPDAIRIHEQSPNVYLKQPLYKGELAKDAISKSHCSVEGSFYASREAHLSVEGDTMQGYWDSDGNMVIQCKSQCVGWTRPTVGAAVGFPLEKIRIIENPTGASFGWAASPSSYCFMGACLMLIKDRILTLTMSYDEHQHFSGKRSPMHMNGRLACDEKGKLTAMEFDVGMERGPYTEVAAHIIDKVMRFMGYPYYIPNVTGLGRIGLTNHNFATAYRGFGCTQAYCCSEAMMDMLAEKMGMDPFEFRYANVAREGQDNINSYTFKEYPMEEIMNTARPLYQAALARAKAESTDLVKRGVGVTCGGFTVTLGSFDHAEVALELHADGTIKLGNRLAVEGQAYGGLSHGISYALSVEYNDLKDGGSLVGCGVPFCSDIPDKFELTFLENPRKVGPFGSSGCSELFQSSGHVAVINAIKNAVGVRIYELPAKPEKVKAAMEAKARGEELKPKKYFLGSELYDELEELKANPIVAKAAEAGH